MPNKLKLNIERKSRMILGGLALIALFIFLMTTFSNSRGVLIGTIATGILASILIYSEAGIVSWIKKSGWKTLTFGDLAVFLGFIAGTALMVFSLSLIPTIGEALPASIISFTTTFARIIAGASIAVVLMFILTPKFE